MCGEWRGWVGIGRLTVTAAQAVVVVLILLNVAIALRQPVGDDASMYWDAALRLRSGEPLYLPHGVDDNAYLYSPWFAVMLIPLTYLPKDLAVATIVTVMCAGSAWLLWQLASRRAWALVVLFVPILLQFGLSGNVQGLMVATLLFGAERVSGPFWIGLAASLKATPLAFSLVYLGRRQWLSFGVAVGVALALSAPMLFFDLSDYRTFTGGNEPLPLPLLVLLVAFVALATIRFANDRYRWLLAGLVVMLALPRAQVYNLTFLLVGLAAMRPSDVPIRNHVGK